MGGLVIKKAFILGHEIPELTSLVQRTCSIFFLATPHQGSDLAQTLGRILSLAPGSRPFVQDLSPYSPVLESINEEFPRYCSNLQLFSFFENKPTNYVIGRSLIVEKHCAVMNYVNERKMYLNANHQDVARFSSPNESSYIALRNALATYIEGKRGLKSATRQLAGHHQLEALNRFLGVSDAPEDDVMTQDAIRLPGSCEWLAQKDCFQAWQDASCPRVLWLRGRPGVGKTVLSSYAINRMRNLGRDCCFFFFSDRDKNKGTMNSFLRAMAWQMAMMHHGILSTILEIAANWQDTATNQVDHNTIWRRLYLRGILKVRLNKPQYWVIDSLDECKGASELMAFLTRAQEHWPLCLLVTSRVPINTYMGTTNPTIDIVSETILEEDTNQDIALFLKANLDSLPSPTWLGRKAMAEEILQASNGCFLWVHLVLKELRQVNASAEIRKVLSSNPETMDGLYRKILTDMANAKFGKKLAKAILTWTACSLRPLSTEEIHRAIELDIDDTIDDVERSISTCCGNLVYVDSRKKVQLIHLTAREFLTRQDTVPEFIIERVGGHRRLALVCLRYLTSNEMKATRPRKLIIRPDGQEKSPFANYACRFLFQHLVYVRSYDDEIFIALSRFLRSVNVLSWIEHLASQGDLQRVFQAGKTINNLLNRRSQHTPPMGLHRELALVGQWGNDLIHLVTKFGKQLSLYPSSIHHIIPPFCPRDSALKRQFTSSRRGLSVHGISAPSWDDCSSIITYPKPARPTTVATSDRYVAIGESTGTIIVYDRVTFQEVGEMQHREPVWCLIFGETGRYIASAGVKLVRVWDLQLWTERCKISVPHMCIALNFAEEDCFLYGATKHSQLFCWDITEGGIPRYDPMNWTRDFEEKPSLQSRRPTIASFCSHQNLLAIVYRGEDILLWDYEQDRIHDIYEKESGSRLYGSTKISDGSTTVWSLVFSPAIDTNLLAAAYSDGDLVVYDTSSGTVKGILTDVNAQTLSCAPDGRTLATADSGGTIQLFDFETLKVIYHIRFDGDPIGPRALAFTPDSRRLIDIRGNQCRIWDPVVLLRQDADDENSDTVSVSTAPQEVDYQWTTAIAITAITCVQSASVVFCGKEDGSVHLYDLHSGLQSQHLFIQTAGVPINLIHFDVERGILTCSDSASRVVSREAIRKQRSQLEIRNPLIDIRTGTRIMHVLACGKHSRLLVSGDCHDSLWGFSENTKQTPILQIEHKGKSHWIQHPTNPDQLILVTALEAKIYSWDSLGCLGCVSFTNLPRAFTAVNGVIPLHHPRFFATVAKDPSNTQSSLSRIHVWDFKDFHPDSKAASCIRDLGALSSTIEAVIGVIGKRLVFLDSAHWICSVDVESSQEPLVHHFFLPDDWIASMHDFQVDLGRNGEIIFVKRADLAVIKQGLEVTTSGNF